MAIYKPLADKIRPKTIKEFCGQKHLVGNNQILRTMIDDDKILLNDIKNELRVLINKNIQEVLNLKQTLIKEEVIVF